SNALPNVSITYSGKDQTLPTITCPASQAIVLDASCQGVIPDYTSLATVADNCTLAAALVVTQTPAAGYSVSGTRPTVVTLTASDVAGNKATCSFVVTATDNTPPVIANCPGNIEVATSNCKAIVNWQAPTASDNCAIASFKGTHTSGSEFDVGATVVRYVALDNAGNTSTCSFTVTVIQDQTIAVSNCPEGIEVFADETGNAIVTWEEPKFSGRCGRLLVERSFVPGSRFPIGKTKVRYSAEDALGTKAECVFEISVLLRDLDIRVSKLITPEGDGINDTWEIFDIDQYPDNEVMVFDRWGSRVFQTQGYNKNTNVWDGTRAGNPIPTGTYFYSIRIKFGDRNGRQEGFIELVR
ncbi:MAG: HYR domain-containing protein, partial [Flammeovirgaceae bacterium]